MDAAQIANQLNLPARPHKNLNGQTLRNILSNHCFFIKCQFPIYYSCKRIELLPDCRVFHTQAKRRIGKKNNVLLKKLHNAIQQVSIVHCKQAERKIDWQKNERSTQYGIPNYMKRRRKPFVT